MARVTFQPSGKIWEGPAGKNLLEIIRELDIPIEAACGGVCACSTCHVIVRKGFEALSEMADGEQDRLDMARGVTLESRLSCQSIIKKDADLEVFVPPLRPGATPHEH